MGVSSLLQINIDIWFENSDHFGGVFLDTSGI